MDRARIRKRRRNADIDTGMDTGHSMDIDIETSPGQGNLAWTLTLTQTFRLIVDMFSPSKSLNINCQNFTGTAHFLKIFCYHLQMILLIFFFKCKLFLSVH